MNAGAADQGIGRRADGHIVQIDDGAPGVDPRRAALNEAMLHAIPTFVFVYDVRQRKYVRSNGSIRNFLGYDPDTVAGLDDVAFAASVGHPDEIRDHMEHLDEQRRLARGERIERRLRLKAGDGTWRWYEHTSCGLTFDADGVVEVLGTLHDITRTVEATTRLAESERRFRELFERSPAGTLVINDDGMILDANRAMASMLGRSAVGLVGRCYDDFVHPEERADVAERRRRMAGNGEAADQVDRRLLHADGSIRWAHVLVTRVREHRGFVTLLAFDDITAEREAKDRLQHAAMHDSLTGLANRRLLEDRLELSLSRSRRTGRLTAVLFLDLDKVKRINDTWGHAVGDQVLTVIADRLRTAVRETDTVARIGGDEFVVVSDGALDGEEIGDLADRILRDIAQPIALEATTVVVTASIGIATSAGDGTGDEVMRAADMAMYEAKAAGRARISMAPAP